MLKGLKSVYLKIIQMYHFRLKRKRYTVCTNWWDSNFFGVGLPLFPVGLLLFARWESWTPVFKILLRTLSLCVLFWVFRICEIFLYMYYGRCSKISKTSCLSKKTYTNSADPDHTASEVWSEPSVFAILTLWVPVLITNICFNKKRSVWNFRTLTIAIWNIDRKLQVCLKLNKNQFLLSTALSIIECNLKWY